MAAVRKIIGEKVKQFSDRLRFSHKADLSEQLNLRQFHGNRGKHEAFVPLIKTFRFVHEPVGTASTSQFIGREGEMESLAERILFSEGGSFLVTGYRGVGKTSFVNQVVRTLHTALPWAENLLGATEIVDIYLNVARPVQPSELMHHIIRRLHDRLMEKGSYHFLDAGLQQAIALAYHRTSVNMARRLAESSERSFGFNEASIGGDWLKAAVKMSWTSKRNRTQDYEISYLGYDDKAAEHDIISIANRLTSGYVKPISGWSRLKLLLADEQPPRVRLKIVFVFDELDKLEEFTAKASSEARPVIDQILGALKNLFTTSGVTFIFVAGKDLQERWLDEVGKGDSVYESVFSYDKYLPCLWTDVDAICDTLVNRIHGLPRYAHQLYEEFKKYLAYKGRGIPRRIIRTFNEYVEWHGDQPLLVFTRPSVRRIRFFAGLQDVLSANGKLLFGESNEESVGTQSDKRRLGVYYLIDWILRQASSEFRLKDVLNASKRLSSKIALAEEVLPRVAADILKTLLDGDYIQEVPTSLVRVVIDQANGVEDAKPMDEKRYKISPRRLGEIAGLAAKIEVDVDQLPLSGEPLENEDKISIIGHYEVVKKIAQGGMGAIYEATDQYNGRKVAIKMMMGDMSVENARRFEREAMIMNELNHPNIVRFYEWGRVNERLYIAMDYLDGLTLEQLITNAGKLSLPLAFAIAHPVADAIDYVHEKGFVRNDIKPSNIMLTNTGRVCLLDFGITRPITSQHDLLARFNTERTVIIGTPQFMAPEQFEGVADRRSDVYALGVVLYRMLTGAYPFNVSQRLRFGYRPELDQTLPLLSQHEGVPEEIDEVISKCLAKDPDSRFQTMSELKHALRDAVGDLPPVEMKGLVNLAQREVKEVQAMDGLPTLEPTTPFNAASLALPTLAAYSVRHAPARSSPPATYSKEPTGPITLADLKWEQLLSAVPANAASLILFRGRAEDIACNFTVVGSTYLLENKTSVGRSSDNTLVLRNTSVSRYHGEFDIKEGKWFVEDLNSHLGTFVNEEKILTRRLLNNGDKIQIADFIFLFNQNNGSQQFAGESVRSPAPTAAEKE
jgi:serine/threonine protein kinase/Cdc6-like AAA superfamily ATPase